MSETQSQFQHIHHDTISPTHINTHNLKEDLSRMEGEYGAKMLGKLKQMNIFIIGLNGIGIETAKNILLAGPQRVDIYDNTIVTIKDLNCNFYLHEQHIKQNITRCNAVYNELASLNPNVQVVKQNSIDINNFKQYDVIVVCNDIPLDDVIQYNTYCHNNNIVFIYCAIHGLTGFVYSDFGEQHNIFDGDGTPSRSIIIDNIIMKSDDNHGLVTIDGDRHLLNNNDYIKFDEIVGMNDNNSNNNDITFDYDDEITDINQTLQIHTTNNPKQFLIGKINKLNEYKYGGVGVQVKKTITKQYKNLHTSLYKPQFNEGYFDFTKFGRDAQLHLGQLAIWQYQKQYHKLPSIHSTDDSNNVVELAKSINQQYKLVDDIDIPIIYNLSLYYQTELPALTALFGGIVAQEVTKQTGKYTPIEQWFYYDIFELLESYDRPVHDACIVESRYAHQIAILGQSIQNKIESQNLFLVGCGALGCEYLKSIALTGLGCTNGNVYITDDDRIELSNLSRQFLFRRQHVGKSKSVSAGQAAIQMNNKLSGHLHIHEIRVEPKTEDTFDDKFWQSLDFVVNALDNMIARQYVDSQCVWYDKPLFESGTLGTQANSVVCLPHKTPSYSEGAVAGEDQGIAKCTLRNFPSDIIHCIEYAREKFDDLYVSGADNTNSYLSDQDAFIDKIKSDPLQQLDTLKSVKQWLQYNQNPTKELCIQLLYNEFIQTYRNTILDLITAFPRDARIIEQHTGADLGPFWHGHKRFPTPITQWDSNNNAHVDYIYHGANIMAKVFNLPSITRNETIEIASSIQPPIWKYSGSVNVEDEKSIKGGEAVSSKDILPDTNTQQQQSEQDSTMTDNNNDKNNIDVNKQPDDNEQIEQITHELQDIVIHSKQHKLQPQEFEKDDDTNHHVDWINSAANLRAFNYNIKPATRQKTRMTAGKIIPAIATTTATITGFILVEIYKYISNRTLESYRAATINLGTNTYVCEQLPDPIRKKSGLDQTTYMDVKAIPEGFTVWDHVTIHYPDCTIQQFIDKFKEIHHNCEIDMLATSSGTVLYNSLDLYSNDPNKKQDMQQRLNSKLIDVFTNIVGPVFPANRAQLQLDCTVETEEGETGIVPKIKYIFK